MPSPPPARPPVSDAAGKTRHDLPARGIHGAAGKTDRYVTTPAPAGTSAPDAAEKPDHDGRWKDALDAYFAPCLQLFWPELHAHVDWRVTPVFRDKELQRLGGAARRGRRYVDKLAEVRLLSGVTALLFIHIEVQAELNADFLPRMYAYHYRLWDRHEGRDTVHLGILTRSSGGPPALTYRQAPLGGAFSRLEFVFPVVHLASWRTRREELRELAAHNPFAVVALADLEATEAQAQAPAERLRRKTALVRLLYEYGYDQADVQRLFTFIDGLLVLPRPEGLAFTETVAQLEGEYDVAYVTSVERIGIEKGMAMGLEQGRADGARQALSVQLERRFGPLPATLQERLAQAAPEEVQVWLERILDARSLDEVFAR